MGYHLSKSISSIKLRKVSVLGIRLSNFYKHLYNFLLSCSGNHIFVLCPHLNFNWPKVPVKGTSMLKSVKSPYRGQSNNLKCAINAIIYFLPLIPIYSFWDELENNETLTMTWPQPNTLNQYLPLTLLWGELVIKIGRLVPAPICSSASVMASLGSMYLTPLDRLTTSYRPRPSGPRVHIINEFRNKFGFLAWSKYLDLDIQLDPNIWI